ncbi:MAG TPA: hypothetical protein VKT30_01205 [Caulobacteraceae bacterium]|nr:hypothetical protein [Caulobacteraceae bacterium]
MTPTVQAFIGDVAARLGMVFAPDLKSPYLAGSAGLTAAVLMMAAEEADRAAHRLVEENRAIRGIFKDAVAHATSEVFADELRTLAAGEDNDLRISVLQAANNDLRRALIELHAAVERDPGPAARRLDAEIWSELAESTRRRAFNSVRF